MREAERQKEEAIAFAESTNKQKSELEGRLSRLDKSYTSEFEYVLPIAHHLSVLKTFYRWPPDYG